MQRNENLPFTAFVGEERAKRALMVNMIDNTIGGALLIGPEGTGKKTLCRSVKELIPDVDAVRDCQFHCDPLQLDTLCTWCKQQGSRRRVTTLTPSFIEYRHDSDRNHITGYINFGEMIRKTTTPGNSEYDTENIGIRIDDELAYVPGSASLANRGVLFIPDIERLDDDMADLIVRFKSLRQGSVEEEGTRFEFPTSFFLVATTSAPELVNPRIMEAMTLKIDMDDSSDMETHSEVADRVHGFEASVKTFRKQYTGQQTDLRQKINRAARFSARVTTPENIWTAIEHLGEDFEMGEKETLAIERTARALCAYERRQRVATDDVALAADLVVPRQTIDKYFI